MTNISFRAAPIKIGSLGHMEGGVVARKLAEELGASKEEAVPLEFELLCMGDMGGIKGFYMRTNEWWGGDENHLKNGRNTVCVENGV